jgi:C4-dicarboxylate-binding protein DctP
MLTIGLRLAAATAAFALALCGAPAHAAEKIVLKIAHATALTSVKGKTFDLFKRLAEEHLKGRIEVQHFHSGQLFNAEKILQNLPLGAVHMTADLPEIYASLVPELNVFGQPFVFTSPKMARAALTDPEIGGRVNAKLEAKGIKVVSVWANGWRVLASRKEPITTLEHMKGLKVRVPAGKLFIDTFKALGANPQAMPWPEVYTALSQGVIDVVEPTPSNIYSSKLHEVAPSITQSNQMFSGYLLMVTKRWWEGLPADVRGELEGIVKETTDWNWKEQQHEDDEAYTKMRATPRVQIVALSREERKRWAEAVRPVHLQYEGVVGKAIFAALYGLADKYQ